MCRREEHFCARAAGLHAAEPCARAQGLTTQHMAPSSTRRGSTRPYYAFVRLQPQLDAGVQRGGVYALSK